MKILLITGKSLPIFNNENRGAIEKLMRIYLLQNEIIGDNFTVYSPKISNDNYDKRELSHTAFRNIDLTGPKNKTYKYLYAIKRRIKNSKNNEYYIRKIIKDLITRHEENAYDLIIFENEEASIPLFKKQTQTKTKIVLHLHNDFVNRDEKSSKQILDSCDEVWAVSKFIAKRVQEVKPIKTVIIPNTYEKSKPDRAIVNKLSETYEAKDNSIFVFLGRLKKVKGVLELISAFNKFNNENPKSKLLLIGDTNKNASGRNFNRQITKAIGKNENIVRVGYIKPNDTINYLSIADAQFIPSIWNEAFGLVVLEGMDAGLPIIATNSGGIPEIGENKIKYVARDNLEQNLLKALNEFKKQPRVDYSNILRKYTVERFCINMFSAIHSKGLERLK